MCRVVFTAHLTRWNTSESAVIDEQILVELLVDCCQQFRVFRCYQSMIYQDFRVMMINIWDRPLIQIWAAVFEIIFFEIISGQYFFLSYQAKASVHFFRAKQAQTLEYLVLSSILRVSITQKQQLKLCQYTDHFQYLFKFLHFKQFCKIMPTKQDILQILQKNSPECIRRDLFIKTSLLVLRIVMNDKLSEQNTTIQSIIKTTGSLIILKFKALNNVLQARKQTFSQQAIWQMQQLSQNLHYIITYSLLRQSQILIGCKDLRITIQFIKFSQVLTTQNMHQVASIIRTELQKMQTRIHQSCLIARQWIQSLNQYADFCIKIQKEHLAQSFKQKIYQDYKRIVKQHNIFMRSTISWQIYNQYFWLNELWIFALKLKKLVTKFCEQNKKCWFYELFQSNQPTTTNESIKSFKIQVYKIYQTLLGYARKLDKLNSDFKQTYSQQINCQKETIQSKINQSDQNKMSKKINDIFNNWLKQFVVCFQVNLQNHQVCWKYYFERVSTHIDEVLSKQLVRQPIKLGGKRQKKSKVYKLPQFQMTESCCTSFYFS